ncbi:MAG: endoglucanase [Methanobacteriaceae archaeon]|nr:endoglucanase [Methanobacteriaceae archaeon]
MEHANIIISVIIVLCIAAGVTAYGLTNPDNAFSDLAGFTPSANSLASAGNGLGNNTTQATDTNNAGSSSSGSASSGSNGVNSGTSNAGSGSSSGSSGSGSGSSSGISGGSNSGSSSGSSGSNSHSGSGVISNHNTTHKTTSNITSDKAIEIASQYVEEQGCYVSSAVWKNNEWYCYIHNANGKTVDVIVLDGNGTEIGEG